MRTLSALALAALSGAHIVSRRFARFTMPAGVFGAHDGDDVFDWDNGSGPVTYYGMGAAAKITLPTLQTALRTDPAQLQLSATDPVLLAKVFDEDYRAAPVDIGLLFYDPATGQPGEEWLSHRGKADQVTITDEPIKPPSADDKVEEASMSTLTMTIAPQTVDLKRSRGRVANDPDQRLFRDPNDGFFKDVALAGVSQMNWGQAGTSSPATSAFNQSAAGAPSGLGSIFGGGGRGVISVGMNRY